MEYFFAAATAVLGCLLIYYTNRNLLKNLYASIAALTHTSNELYNLRIEDLTTLLKIVPSDSVRENLDLLLSANDVNSRNAAESVHKNLLPDYIQACKAEIPESSDERKLLLRLPEINNQLDKCRTSCNSLVMLYNKRLKSPVARYAAKQLKLSSFEII